MILTESELARVLSVVLMSSSSTATAIGASAASAGAWLSASRTFPVRASVAKAWAVSSAWDMAWANIPDVKLVSATERVINGDIFESLLELDEAKRTHAWSYDRIPAAWGMGTTPQMTGRVTVLEGATPNECAIEYTMSAVPLPGDEAKIAGILEHEAVTVGPKLVAFIEALGKEEL